MRFEDFPEGLGLSFSKANFVEVVRQTKNGKANIKRSFPDGPKKVTAIFVDCIPKELQILIKGIMHISLFTSLTVLIP